MTMKASGIIGTIGSTGSGKSRLVEAITGTKTMKHSSELKRNLSIKLGYANFNVYQCECEKYGTTAKCECGKNTDLLKSFSFVDCPGHEYLMSTMLTGASAIDAAILVIAANEEVPQPQTVEHLIAAEIMNIRKIVVAQTKVDLVTKEKAYENKKQIEAFLKGTSIEGAPIVPIDSTKKINISQLLKYLLLACDTSFNREAPPIFKILRSFDVNKPGTQIDRLIGGIVGGVLNQGQIKTGDCLEIVPGLIREGGVYEPISTFIRTIKTENTNLTDATPGLLLALGTTLDPTLSSKDKLVGQIIATPGTIKCMTELKVKVNMLNGIKLMSGETISVIIGGQKSQAQIENSENNGKKYIGRNVVIKLKTPCCILDDTKIVILKNKKVAGFANISSGSQGEMITLPTFEADYDQLLSNMDNQVENISKTLRLPQIKMFKQGRSTVISNFGEISQRFNRPDKDLIAFLSEELATTINQGEDNRLTFRARLNQPNLVKLLLKFAADHIRCSTCKSLDTVIQVEDRLRFKVCTFCTSKICVM